MPVTRKTTAPTKATTKAPAKATPAKATAAAPAPTPALNAAEQSHANHATAFATLERREKALTESRQALDDLVTGLGNGDESVTSAQVRDARYETERWTALVAAAEVEEAKARHAIVNTSTALADALAPYLENVTGLEPSTAWEKRAGDALPESVPSAVLVQEKTETDNGDGFLSGECVLYFSRTRLHALPNASAMAESLESLGVNARVSDGWTTKHEGDPSTHSYMLRVEKVAPRVPVIGATKAATEGARKAIGYALADVITPAFLLTEDALVGLRASLGSNGLFDQANRYGVSVQTGTPALYSDTTDDNGTRTVSVVVTANCVIRHKKTRALFVPRLREALPGLIAETVGTMVPNAGRISATDVQNMKTGDDLEGVMATVLVSYVSTLPNGENAPAYVAPVRSERKADDVFIEDGDEDLADYIRSLSQESDIHGDRKSTHPGVAL